MKQTLFDLTDKVKALRPGITEREAVQYLEMAEQEILGRMGGVTHPVFGHYLRGTMGTTIEASDNTITLPSGTGRILPGGLTVNDRPWTLIREEDGSAQLDNPLYRECAIRRGNNITLYGLGEDRYRVNVIFERAYETILYRTGLRVQDDQQAVIRYTNVTAHTLRVWIPLVTRVSDRLYADNELLGATARLLYSAHEAIDYSIAGNLTIVRDGDGLVVEIGSAVQSIGNDVPEASQYVSTEIYVANGERTRINFPEWVDQRISNVQLYPLILTRLMMPAQLYPVMINWVRYNLIRDESTHRDYENSLAAFLG